MLRRPILFLARSGLTSSGFSVKTSTTDSDEPVADFMACSYFRIRQYRELFPGRPPVRIRECALQKNQIEPPVKLSAHFAQVGYGSKASFR